MAEILGEEDFSGVALNDVERREFVMRAEEVDHEGFAISMRRDQPKTIRVETRMTLTEFEKAVFKTGMTLRDGVTAVVQTSGVGFGKKTWRMTATIVKVDEVVGRFLEQKK